METHHKVSPTMAIIFYAYS